MLGVLDAQLFINVMWTGSDELKNKHNRKHEDATLESLEYVNYPTSNAKKVVPVTPKVLPERAQVGSER